MIPTETDMERLLRLQNEWACSTVVISDKEGEGEIEHP
jgi:hypothetical protein